MKDWGRLESQNLKLLLEIYAVVPRRATSGRATRDKVVSGEQERGRNPPRPFDKLRTTPPGRGEKIFIYDTGRKTGVKLASVSSQATLLYTALVSALSPAEPGLRSGLL